MRLHKYLLLGVTAIVAMAAMTAVALGTTSKTTGPAGVKVAVTTTGLGRILVDGQGRTLYLLEKDRNGKSACTGKCAGVWPPLLTSARPLAGAGAKASLLGTVKRPGGRLQATYNHHPLYTFVKDTRKGQTNGEALDVFGAEWYAVSTAGARVEKKDAGSGGGDPYPGGYGY